MAHRRTTSRPDHRPGFRLRGESLEPREMLTFNPTAIEQAYMESINRMRTDPQGELSVLFSDINSLTARDAATRGAIDFFDVSPQLLLSQWSELEAVAPVAWNEQLTEAARKHSELMVRFDEQAHDLPGESGLGDRIRAEGYSLQRATENIYAFAENHLHGHGGFVIDWGEGPGGIQDPAGHRDNYMDPGVSEVGIGVSLESNSTTDVGPELVTHNFGRRGGYVPQIVGSVYTDANGNGIYDPGEGHGNAAVTVRSATETFTTRTLSAGGYQIEVPDGTYEVVVSGGGLNGSYVLANVEMDGENIMATIESGSAQRPPTARPDSFTLDEDTSTSFSVTPNDTADSGAIVSNSVRIEQAPSRGTATVNGSGRVTYTPNPNVSGSDSFTYSVRDTSGARSNVTTVSLTINGLSDSPVLTSNFTGTTSVAEDGRRSINIGGMVVDPDGDLNWNSLRMTTTPTNGQAVVSGANREIVYTPNPGFSGSDSLAFQVSDADGNQLPPTTIAITVTPVNDRPIATDDLFTLVDRSSANLTVLSNDFDPDGTLGSGAIQILTQPRVGTASIDGSNLRFTASQGFVGAVEIRYRVRDTDGAFSDPSRVTVFSISSDGNPWQNPDNRFDVNGDGNVTPIDALQVINNLGTQLSPPTPGVSRGASPFLDVRGNGVVAPIDALQVINELSAAANRSSRAALSATADVTDELFADEDDDESSEDSLPLWYVF